MGCNDCIPDFHPTDLEMTVSPNGDYLSGWYCVQNTGGPYSGELTVGNYMGGDISGEFIEDTHYVSYSNRLLWGGFEVVQTVDGIDMFQHTRMGGSDGAYCFFREQEVYPSNNYFFNVHVNTGQAIEETDYDNNHAHIRLEGTPQSFPRVLIEEDVGPIEYHGSAHGESYLFDGEMFEGWYTDVELRNSFSVGVFFADDRRDAQRYFDNSEGDYVETGYGPMKLFEDDNIWEFDGMSYKGVGMIFLGTNKEIIQTWLVRPADEDWDPIQHPLILRYLERYHSAANFCGNGICEPGEDEVFCYNTCPICTVGAECPPCVEICVMVCPEDCGFVPPTLCGNGIVDYRKGEMCDDGNNQVGDGCDSACMHEEKFCTGGRQAYRFVGLDYYTNVGSIDDNILRSDLPTLFDSVLNTDDGPVTAIQRIRFAPVDNMFELKAEPHTENEQDIFGDYVVVDDNKPFVRHVLFFQGDGVRLTELGDMTDEVLYFYEVPYKIMSSEVNGSFRLTLAGNGIGDVIRRNETKLYAVNGNEYEVTLVFVDEVNRKARFTVNGELTDSLAPGEYDVFSSGMKLFVKNMLINSRETVVEFELAPDMVEITETTPGTTGDFAGALEFNSENIEDAEVDVEIVNGEYLKAIRTRITADARVGSTIYVEPDHTIRDYLDEPEAFLGSTFEIFYGGLIGAVYEYESYDSAERVVTFEDFYSGVNREAAVQPNGEGVLVVDGYAYPFLIDDVGVDDSELQISWDQDDIYDVSIETDSRIAFTPTLEGADVYLVNGACVVQPTTIPPTTYQTS